MVRKLLTLAISQMDDREYVVICYDKFKSRLISIELSREDIEFNGTVYFDIGAVTEVEELREGELVYVVGTKKIIQRYTREQLKNFFEREKLNIEAFKINRNVNPYAIIKITSVIDFYIKQNKLRMSFWSSGVRADYLVKDVRWTTYAEGQMEKKHFSQKLLDYRKLFNNQEKTAYAIIFKYKVYDVVWIAGLHLL